MANKSGVSDFLTDVGATGVVMGFAVGFADTFAEVGIAHEDWVTVCTGIAGLTGFIAALFSSFGYLMFEKYTLARCTKWAFKAMFWSAALYAVVWLIAKYAPIDTPTSTWRSDALVGPVSAVIYVVMVTAFIGWAAGFGKQIRRAEEGGSLPSGGQN